MGSIIDIQDLREAGVVMTEKSKKSGNSFDADKVARLLAESDDKRVIDLGETREGQAILDFERRLSVVNRQAVTQCNYGN